LEVGGGWPQTFSGKQNGTMLFPYIRTKWMINVLVSGKMPRLTQHHSHGNEMASFNKLFLIDKIFNPQLEQRMHTNKQHHSGQGRRI